MAKILIVEDDFSISDAIQEWLKLDHHKVEAVANGADAYECLRMFEYDLIVLDWMLPELTGDEICKRFRESGGKTPVLMLTVKDTVPEKAEGLDAGADDYLTKPFHPEELRARVRALLRRPPEASTPCIQIGKIVLDPQTHRVTKCGQDVSLEPVEFDLLEFLFRHPDEAFTPTKLLSKIWNGESGIDAIYTAIKRLRQKLEIEGEPSLITTARGAGYSVRSK
jgi:DNA-binding response OmpR family regulator